MYAVIFRAEVAEVDEQYLSMAQRMRDLAIDEYGCLEFTAVTEGKQEIAISYWESKQQIKAWRENPEHQEAQRLGQSRWYRSYRVQVVKVERDYQL
ncbi:MAG: antibiotic biosynthesis monooxygenase [Amphritea sp.]|nr:antibiotic biosynthesis monooxygenase [Amphritea sp.]